MNEEQTKKDKIILNQLYNGLHLEDNQLERAVYILHALNLELKKRIKWEV